MARDSSFVCTIGPVPPALCPYPSASHTPGVVTDDMAVCVPYMSINSMAFAGENPSQPGLSTPSLLSFSIHPGDAKW